MKLFNKSNKKNNETHRLPMGNKMCIRDRRNIEIKVRPNRKEAEALNKRVKKSRLSREEYLRHLFSGVVPQYAPPPDYFDFMRELHGVGNNLNQIAQKAHVLGVIDERRYDEEMRKFDQLVRDITKAVILPRPME